MLKQSRAPAFTLYIIAAACFIIYTVCSVYSGVVTTPFVRLFLLGLVCLFIYIGSFLLSKAKPEDQKKIMKITFIIFFALYLLFLLNVLFFDKYFGRTGFTAGDNAAIDIRTTPFATIKGFLKSIKTGGHSKEQIVTNLLGNLVIFMPFALFLPLFSARLRRTLPFLLTIAGAVTVVELLQILLRTGVCDIDDLILNTFGAMLAFGILKIKPIKRWFTKFTKLEY